MLFVCNEKFERIGYVGNFSYLLWRKKYEPGSEAELHVDVTAKNIEMLKKGNIIYRQDDNEAMYIYYRQFDDSSGVDQLVIKCFSLFRWADRRILWNQYDFNTTPEKIMRQLINDTMINPTDFNQKISNVQLSNARNFGAAIQQQISYKGVYEVCENLCTTHDIGARCLFDGQRLLYDFYEGANRTINQSSNPRIILSKSRGNLLKRTYEDANNDFKNTVLIAGAGEGSARKTATIGNGNSGLNRREVFIDAREISDKKDVDGEQVPIPDDEYMNLLTTKGKEKLAEYAEFIGFDCELDVTKENTKYNEDFYLGDLITIKDDELGILMNSRVMQADEVFQDSGKSIYITVGKSTPTVFEKMQSEIKNAKGVGATTGGSSGNGQPGTPGSDGVGLDYIIDGTSIGIKREDETNYTYVNTKGEPGRNGRDGADGRSFTFADLTPAQKEELRGERGLRGLPGDKGDPFVYSDFTPSQIESLRGPQGIPGVQGKPGKDAEVTSGNVIEALGYTPTKASDITWDNVLSKPTTFTPTSHSHPKSDVGLGDVQNYGIATQAQATTGVADNVYMTPLKTKQAIETFASSSGGDNYMMIDGQRVNWSLGVNPTTAGLIFIYE